ncbi:MAG: Hsp20/alpha crystallin family protein [Pseudomonadota bacterium]
MFELLKALQTGQEWSHLGDAGSDVAKPFLGWAPLSGSPHADVHETADAIRVVLDLPGYAPDSLAIEFEKGVLSIAAERKRETDSDKTLLMAERGFGKVRRAFTVTVPVDPDRVAAEYDRGVLTVTLPKRAEAKPRKIDIAVK